MSRPLIPKIWNTEYTCGACGYRAAVKFTDPDGFAEDEPVGGRDKWTQNEALREAQVRIEKRGRRAMRLVRCPRCQRRDAESVRRAYLWAALPLLGAAPAAFAISIIVASQLWPGRTSLRGPALGAVVSLLLSVLIVLRGQRNLVVQAEKSLLFGGETT